MAITKHCRQLLLPSITVTIVIQAIVSCCLLLWPTVVATAATVTASRQSGTENMVNTANAVAAATTVSTTTVSCNYTAYPSTGCPPDGHQLCSNLTNTCHCDPAGHYRIEYGPDQCLAMKSIDDKCVTSDQCTKTAKSLLYCYHFDSIHKKLVKLETTAAVASSGNQHNRSAASFPAGFCRCDDHHYYDYEANQCRHLNDTTATANNNNGLFPTNEYEVTRLTNMIDEYFCSQCSAIDDHSHCDRKTVTCQCNDGYLKTHFGKCVAKRQLYQRCGHSDECVVTNSYCEPIVRECICSSGYIPDSHRKYCMKGRQLFERCTEQRECTYLYGQCNPVQSVCLCDSSSVLLNTYAPACAKRTGYGQPCDQRHPDVVCALTTSHTLCNRQTSRCVCQNGYMFVGNECHKMTANSAGVGGSGSFANDHQFHDDMMDTQKNPMTYIVIIFCTVFGFTIFASILIKMFRKPFTRTQLALYDINTTLNHMQANQDRGGGGGGGQAATTASLPLVAAPATAGIPNAPPMYTEREALRPSCVTTGGTGGCGDGNEDKPPSYEEAISGQFAHNV